MKDRRQRHLSDAVPDSRHGTQAPKERDDLNSRLIDAQEQERKRLAQEIHDDLSQRFAVVAIKLQSLSKTPQGPQASALIQDLIADVAGLDSDLRAMSHRLYSPLKLLGLVRNIVSLCTEVGRDPRIEIVCEHRDIPNDLSERTVLTVFRVVQEALHNVAKHSRASKAHVKLTGTPDRIALTVIDNGIGLDSQADGLGIQSMRERVRMVGGVFRIDTRPAIGGTRIVVSVPVTSRRCEADTSGEMGAAHGISELDHDMLGPQTSSTSKTRDSGGFTTRSGRHATWKGQS